MNSIALGSVSGSVDIFMDNYGFFSNLSGLNLVGIGSVSDGSGKITMISGEVKSEMYGRSIKCIGTRNGSLDIDIKHSDLNHYCEGNNVSGIGDMEGDGNIDINDCTVKMTFRTQEGMGIVSKGGKVNFIKSTKVIDINT